MSASNYDIEWAAADVVTAHLRTVLDADWLAACPCVAFFDPMSMDDADRLVVMVPNGQTTATQAAGGDVTVEVGLKTRWKQPTIAADFGRHRGRVNDVRDKLWAANLVDGLNAAAVAAEIGLRFDWVDLARGFNTSVRDGWNYSEVQLKAHFFIPERT